MKSATVAIFEDPKRGVVSLLNEAHNDNACMDVDPKYKVASFVSGYHNSLSSSSSNHFIAI